MISFIENINNRKVYSEVSEITPKIRRAVRQAFFKTSRKCYDSIRKAIMEKPRYGRVYYLQKNKAGQRFVYNAKTNSRKVKKTKGGKWYRHVASRPGEAPANFTGTLKRSLDFISVQHEYFKIFYEDSAYYGGFLEFGTKVNGKWRIEPRPAIGNAIEEHEGYFQTQMNYEMMKQFAGLK